MLEIMEGQHSILRVDDVDVAHLGSISQLQLLGDHPTGESLSVCLPSLLAVWRIVQHKLSGFFGTLQRVDHLHQSRVPTIVPNL